MMRCSEARRRIGDLRERDGPPAALAQHLAGCPACARLLDEQRETVRRLQSLPWPEAPRGPRRFPATPAAGARTGIGASGGGRDHPAEDTPAARRRPRPAEVAALALALAMWALALAAPTRAPSPTAAGTATPALLASPTAPLKTTRIGDDIDLPEETAVAGERVSLQIAPDWRVEAYGACRQVWLEPGDGTVKPLTCPTAAERAASQATFEAGTGYPGWGYDPRWRWHWAVDLEFGAPGSYVPQLHLVVADGRHLVQSVAQVVVTATAPAPAWLVRWRASWLRATLALLALAVLGLTLRRTRWRAAALLLGLLALAVLVLGTWADRGPQMAPYLDGLVGATGLDPLDPAEPLTGYRIDATLPRWNRVFTTLRYRDGGERRYALPFEQGGGIFRDGLGRLRTEHRELDGLPFADPSRDGLDLGTPRLVAAAPAADAGPSAWFSAGCLATGNLVSAPDSRHALFAQAAEPVRLSVIDLATGRAQHLADEATDYVWSPDGQTIAAVVPRGEGAAGLALYHLDAQTWRRDDGPAVSPGTRPGTTNGELWFAAADGIRAMNLQPRGDGGHDTRRVTNWPEPSSEERPCPRVAGQLVRPSPDGGRVAYTCGAGLYIQNQRYAEYAIVPGDFADAAWSPDGARLAALEHYAEGAAWLRVIDVHGKVEGRYKVGVGGTIGPPQWSADGRRLYLTTCPLDGRRIITVDRATGAVWDLSRRHWDAWASYLAEPESLLLANGRGGLWRAELLNGRP